MLRRLLGASRPTLVAAVFSLSAPHAVSPIAAQVGTPPHAEARLQGVVVDATTYQPLDSATVSLVGTDITATTGRWGAFSFPDAPLGTVSVHVSAPGRPSVVQDVEVRDDRIVFVQVVLPTVATVLSGLLVQASPPRDRSAGARTAADLLAIAVPRARVRSGSVGKSDYQILLRSGNTLTGDAEPLILIDGVVISGAQNAFDVLQRIPASDVEDIQVLKGPATAFLYPFAANGVINVRTKRGSGTRDKSWRPGGLAPGPGL